MTRQGFQTSHLRSNLRAGIGSAIRPGAGGVLIALILAFVLGDAPAFAKHDGHVAPGSSGSCRACQMSTQLLTSVRAPTALLAPEAVFAWLETLPAAPYRRPVYGVRSERAPPPAPSRPQPR